MAAKKKRDDGVVEKSPAPKPRSILAKPPARKPVRASKKLLEEIIVRMSEGESLREICADDHMPTAGSVISWAKLHARSGEKMIQDFADAYELAKEQRAWLWAEEIVILADTVDEDKDAVAKARLQIDARKWLLAKMLKADFGDRVTQEVTGKDGGAIQVENQVQFYLPDNGRTLLPRPDEYVEGEYEDD